MATTNEAYIMEKTVDDTETVKEKTLSLKEINVPDEMETQRTLYERTLASCGFGRFQIILFLVCGWALASDSAEVQVVSFVLPSACDLKMTSHEKGWLNAIVFVGMMVGGYLLGGAADVKGRRHVLVCSMSVNGTFGLLSAFTPTFLSFLFFRFISGIGVGAAIPILFSYCAEFMNVKMRGPMMGLLAAFWMVGNILTCVSAWIILPKVHLGIQTAYMFFGNWRIFVVIGSIPSISSALFMAMMPESPMFLTKKGRFKEAKKVFLVILHRNCGPDSPIPKQMDEFSEYYSISSDVTTTDETTSSKPRPSLINGLGELATTLVNVMKSTRELFLKPHTHTTVMLIAIWYTLSFGFYGLWMWFPEIFKRVESGGGDTCTHSTTPHTRSNSTFNASSVLTCQQLLATQTSTYLESLLVAVSSIPGNLITILLVNRLGRRPLMACSMILSAVSVFFFTLVKNRAGMIAMSCIFSGMSVVGFNVLDMMSIESYPTHLRTTAFGIQSTCGRIAAITGNVAFGALVDQHCAVPMLLIAILLSAGGLVTLKLPKTDDVPLQN